MTRIPSRHIEAGLFIVAALGCAGIGAVIMLAALWIRNG